MSTHHINAANNGFHWAIAFDSDGNVVEGQLFISNDLYILFEWALLNPQRAAGFTV